MDNVIDLLKRTNARISIDNKWLVWTQVLSEEFEWVVYERLPYARGNKVHYRGESFDEALKSLESYELDDSETDPAVIFGRKS